MSESVVLRVTPFESVSQLVQDLQNPEVLVRVEVLEGEQWMVCETHEAAVHKPEGVADLRCDVWVAAGLDGWPTKEPCSIVPKLLVDP